MSNVSVAVQIGIIGFATAACFISAEYQKPFWFFISITVVISRLIAQTSAKMKNDPTPMRSAAAAFLAIL